MNGTIRMLKALMLATLLQCLAVSELAAAPAGNPLKKIKHLIVIYQENWSFDSLYGRFPGANGHARAGTAVAQVDKRGVPLKTLPRPRRVTRLRLPDFRFPSSLPVAPYDIAAYVPPSGTTGDLVHRFYQNQYQINGGKMDKFAAWSDNPGLVMGYYDACDLPVGRLAREFTLADNFFQAAFGGSFLNHFWLICACTPVWADAPASLRVTLDRNGMLLKDNAVTPDGFAVNTLYSANKPHPLSRTSKSRLLPQQLQPTIGDRLSEKRISWAWYAGGWRDAQAGRADRTFRYHHQPFVYFANYAPGTAARALHLKDEKEFFSDLRAGRLPAVSFIKPLGANNEHPGEASLLQGQRHVADLVQAVMQSPYWKDCAIIITYDEYGGRWDHVAPPKADRWGPGPRVPAIIISPYAKRQFVDHTQYDTTSILKFIETRWELKPLGKRDAAAKDLSGAFDFTQSVTARRAAPGPR